MRKNPFTQRDKETLKNISDNLSFLMNKFGSTQTKVAEAVGVQQPIIGYWLDPSQGEGVSRDIKVTQVQKLADFFGVQPGFFFTPLTKNVATESEAGVAEGGLRPQGRGKNVKLND